MSIVLPPTELLSVAEYLELEDSSLVRREYVHGILRARLGNTDRHDEITVNVTAALHTVARGNRCRVYSSALKIQAAEDVYYYPDASVVCDRTDQPRICKTKPAVLVEVLSQSTSMTDRREKLANYMRLDSLQNYLMIS